MRPRPFRIAGVIASVLAIAACGSGGGSPAESTANVVAGNGEVHVSTTLPTNNVATAPRSATALAAALGCTYAVRDPRAPISIGPTYTADVPCTSHGVAIEIQTYTPAGIAFFHSNANQTWVCLNLEGFGFKGPLYWTIGANFIEFEQHIHPSVIDPNQHAHVRAIADALGTKVTALACPGSQPVTSDGRK